MCNAKVTNPLYFAAQPASSNIAILQSEFVTGRTGRWKTRALGPFPRSAPLNGLGRGVFFGIPCPCPRSGPRRRVRVGPGEWKPTPPHPVTNTIYNINQISCQFLKVNIYCREKEQAAQGRSSPWVESSNANRAGSMLDLFCSFIKWQRVEASIFPSCNPLT